MLVYMVGCSEKSAVLTRLPRSMSMFSQGKYNRGHPVKGQWVFSGVEHESGRTFLVPVPNRTADTLKTIIQGGAHVIPFYHPIKIVTS